MTGYEKITNMSLEELASEGFCPFEFGLKDDEDLCEATEDEVESCCKCRKKALEAEIE